MSSNRTGTDGIDHLFGPPSVRKAGGPPAAGAAQGSDSAEVRELRGGFEEAAREARRIAEGLSALQVNWRPAAGRWSIGDCFGHLNIFGSEVLPLIDGAIGEARRRGWYGGGPLRPGVWARWLLRSTEPPVRRRRTALEHFVPAGDQHPRDALPALVNLNALLVGRLESASGLDMSRPKVAVPGIRLIRLSLYELFRFVEAHGRRHLAQALAVREDPRFPRAAVAPAPGRPSAPARPNR